MSGRILIRGHIDAHGGYGQVTIGIILGLLARGYEVQVWPLNGGVEESQPIPDAVRRCFVDHSDLPAQLVIYMPQVNCGHDEKRTAHFTMWECSRIKREAVDTLNRAVAVIVPNDWNATTFSARGVNQPLYKVPLFVDGEAFPERTLPPIKPFAFGTAGRNLGGVYRKRMDRVAEAFLRAFPGRDDVRLSVKCHPGCEIDLPSDPRIQVIRACMTQSQLAGWFAGLHCFVSANAGGGWELMPHQAMATGRPVIAPKFGGMAEYFDRVVGWEVPYTYGEATDFYAPGGIWADVSVEDLAKVMAQAGHFYRGRGVNAASRAREFTLDRSLDALLPVLHKHGIVV